MFPTIVERGTSEVSLLTPTEANDANPDVPTDVFTNRFVQVDWARETIGVVASGWRTGLPPTDEILCLNTFIMQLSCMTSRKIWVIFVGPMVLPRPAISYEIIPDKLLRLGDYRRFTFGLLFRFTAADLSSIGFYGLFLMDPAVGDPTTFS
jgi:hypothetical protein